MSTVTNPIITSTITNSFCGPFALSYVMGTTPNAAAELLSKISGRESITGIAISELAWTLRKSGIKIRKLPLLYEETFRSGLPRVRQATLAKWFKQADLKPEQKVVVFVEGHVLVVHNGQVFDNSYRQGMSISKCPLKRYQVLRAWAVGQKVMDR